MKNRYEVTIDATINGRQERMVMVFYTRTVAIAEKRAALTVSVHASEYKIVGTSTHGRGDTK